MLTLDPSVVMVLEANDFAALGAPVFAKGHLRRYAALLGVPEDEILGAYERSKQHMAEPSLVPKSRLEMLPGARTCQVAMGAWRGHRVSRRGHAGGVHLRERFAVGTVGGPDDGQTATGNATTELTPPPGTSAAVTGESAAAGGNAPAMVDGTTSASPPALGDATTAGTAGSAASAPAAGAASAAAPGVGQVRLQLRFKGDSWVEVFDGSGRAVLYDLGKGGTERTLTATAPLSVTIGNAAVVNVAVNGRGRRRAAPAGPGDGTVQRGARRFRALTAGSKRMTENTASRPRHERRAAGGNARLANARARGARGLRAIWLQRDPAAVLERTELFKRSIGEFTDIVEKEMYTFVDRGGESLTLRPKRPPASCGRVSRTACCTTSARRSGAWDRCSATSVRRKAVTAVPPVGRRSTRFSGSRRRCRVDPDDRAIVASDSACAAALELNSLGTPASRAVYRAKAGRVFAAHGDALDADSKRRLGGNPLRILDSKNPEMAAVIAGAPLLTDHLDAESAAHFTTLCDTSRPRVSISS
jgi:cytoskeletal protein RodZ